MSSRQYYSMRHGTNPDTAKVELPTLREVFAQMIQRFEDQGYFQEHLGYHCVDEGFVPGSLGCSLDNAIFLELGKKDLLPISFLHDIYSQEDVFDLIEFHYHHCSEPTGGTKHDYQNCGWHYRSFNQKPGQKKFREDFNRWLSRYGTGFRLTESGEIQSTPEPGLDVLLDRPLPKSAPKTVMEKVDAARRQFLRHNASLDDHLNAVRALADAMEWLRPKAKAVLKKKDESDLFELANAFGIRHMRQDQKLDYDRDIWLSWMFYHYLTAIHACTRLIERKERTTSTP